MSEYAKQLFAKPDISMRQKPGNLVYLKSNIPLGDFPATVLQHLYHWAEQRPDTTFLAERDPEDSTKWLSVSYSEFCSQVQQLASNLRGFDLSVENPIMLISGNSIANAMMTFAGYLLGVPVVPVSPSYSLLSKTYEKVLYVQQLTTPGVVFSEQFSTFSGVLEKLSELDLPIITNDKSTTDSRVTLLKDLFTEEVTQDFTPANIAADSTAKILFTSGSTGMPKGVINTHGMLSCNQEAIARVWPFIEEPGHVFLDWLPWHHTFGGNHNFNMVLRNGASLYIDSGKPSLDGVVETVRNIKEISPTLSFNVAAGYDLLAAQLETDVDAARSFFKNLRLIFFAAAALPESTRSRLEALIKQYAEGPVPITSSWGQTETAPAGTTVHFQSRVPNNIGVPVPGTEVKLAPVGDMLELRVKGPNVLPAYYKDPKKTAEAFDEEGYLCTGDAVELCDKNHPEVGLIFKGRVSENFKLQSATWVNVGELRVSLLTALSPLCTDAVICGQDQKFVGALLFPNIQQCQQFLQVEEVTELSASKTLRAEIAKRLLAFNEKNQGSSRRICRALIQNIPPSFEANETTDKGYLNQRGILQNRADQVEMLYGDSLDPKVIVV